MLEAGMRVLLLERLTTARASHRHSSVVWSDDGRFELRDVDPGSYDVLVENAWGDPAACGTVEIGAAAREQNVGTLQFHGWRTLMIHEPRLAARIRRQGVQGRWAFGRVSFLKDGEPARTRGEVHLLLDELAPGHIRMAVPPGLDLDVWGIEIRAGAVVRRHVKLSALLGQVPRVTVVLDRFREHLADPRLQVVVVARREDMSWADGIRIVLDHQTIKDGAWPALDVFPGEWIMGLEMVHTGHGGMALVEFGVTDAGEAGEESRFTPQPRKLGEVIEAVVTLMDR
jgi:hypothetical protein